MPEQRRPVVVPRRHFLGYVVAAPTLVAAAELGLVENPHGRASAAGLPSPEITEILDLNDLMTVAALPTANLITVAGAHRRDGLLRPAPG